MSGEAEVIFGIREVSWPKREGYLYARTSSSKIEKPLVSFHLYRTDDDEFERLLTICLKDWVASPVDTPYVLENFSMRAELAFRKVWNSYRTASEGV